MVPRSSFAGTACLPNQTTGSYCGRRRSFIGIRALSVILMCSGHTRCSTCDVASRGRTRPVSLVLAVHGVQRMHVEFGDAHQVNRTGEGLLCSPRGRGWRGRRLLHINTRCTCGTPASVPTSTAPSGTRRAARFLRRRNAGISGLLVVERDVGHQVADHREGAHRGDGDGLVGSNVDMRSCTHQPRTAVDLRRARAALAGLAVPPHREVGRLLGLHADG